jgi:putative transposase
MCRVLKVSSSGFYHWMKDPEGTRGREECALEEKIKEIFHASRKTYGSRRIYHALRRSCIRCSRRRVCRLMRQLGLCPKRGRKFRITTDSRHGFPVHPNLLARDFTFHAPNSAWVSDITYIWTNEGWLFLASVIDLYSRKVVGWSMSESLKSQVAIDALQMAITMRKPPVGLLHHSDRGVQYACGAYQQILKQAGMLPSMSRKGDCWDNSVAESFFSTLKKELIYQRNFVTKEEARREIFDFIEIFYNRQRMHSYLGNLSPAEFEAATRKAA